MKLFDFHCHPTLKTTFKDGISFDTLLPKHVVSGIVGCCTDLAQIITSQIGVKQFQHMSKPIVGVALYSVETALASDKSLQEIAQGNSGVKQFLDVAVLRKMSDGSLSHFDYLQNVLLPQYENNAVFHLIKSKADLENIPDDKIAVFFTVEGAHTLATTHESLIDDQEVIANIRAINQRVHLLSLNPCHLQPSSVCNHAFGMQLADNRPFIPKGVGLTAVGESIIQGCFNEQLCIDLKHMSVFARQQLIVQMKGGMYANPQPLICTHAGFTGKPFKDMTSFVCEVKKNNKKNWVQVTHCKPKNIDNNYPELPHKPTFNGSTINLFDEEIIYIVRNGGLIGLSLDRRICGHVDRYDDNPFHEIDGSFYTVDREFFSLQEFAKLSIDSNRYGEKTNADYCQLQDELYDAITPPSLRMEFHLLQIMLQLKHFLHVCVKDGIPLADAQQAICIGSDFDGLINPFNCALTIDDLPDLRNKIANGFAWFLKQYPETAGWRDQLNIPLFIDQLFYDNGYRFLQSRLI